MESRPTPRPRSAADPERPFRGAKASPGRCKSIVICCDGTGRELGSDHTNVARLLQSLTRDGGQVVYYRPGLGTSPHTWRPVRAIHRFCAFVFGAGLQRQIEDAYAFLMDRYEPGDRVFLFGYSRGGFAVRALAGMLEKVGLLERGNEHLIPRAGKLYNRHGNDRNARRFKEACCRDCVPYFIGAWDTVASLGRLVRRRFYATDVSASVRHAYHAVATDEERMKFGVHLWSEIDKPAGQSIEQVWFPGEHADVGGRNAGRGLSDLSLEWMLEKAAAAGLALRPDWRERLELRPDPLGPIHATRVRYWRLWRPVTRALPHGARVHRSVLDRARALAEYAPRLPRLFVVVGTAGAEAATALEPRRPLARVRPLAVSGVQ